MRRPGEPLREEVSSKNGKGGGGRYARCRYNSIVGLALLAPHTNGPRDVPRCGALSLLQKTRTTWGIQQISLLAKAKFVGSDWSEPPLWNS
jgi:hypothetical protein